MSRRVAKGPATCRASFLYASSLRALLSTSARHRPRCACPASQILVDAVSPLRTRISQWLTRTLSSGCLLCSVLLMFRQACSFFLEFFLDFQDVMVVLVQLHKSLLPLCAVELPNPRLNRKSGCKTEERRDTSPMRDKVREDQCL